MRPARNNTFIATIADVDGWLFEHVVDAPSAASAERELRSLVQPYAMTLLEIRPVPPENAKALRVPRRIRALRALMRITRTRVGRESAPSLGVLRHDASSSGS